MFTGIVEEVGTVAEIRREPPGLALTVSCATVLEGTGIGDSINTSGCCLTVTETLPDGFVAEVMGETLERTGLGDLEPGDPVNLERALRADARLGGHLVQGHVDAVGRVVDLVDEGAWTRVGFELPSAIARYVVEKGSIAVDGVSLTVASVDDAAFSVGVVPHTLAVTTFGRRATGDRVNLEVDVLAKYVERLLVRDVATPYDAPGATASGPGPATTPPGEAIR